jgi:hypothetical protein
MLANFEDGPIPLPGSGELMEQQRDILGEYSQSVNTGLMMSLSPNSLDNIPPFHVMQVSVAQPNRKYTPDIAIGLVHTQQEITQ